jgi:hypothetical protein
MGLMRNAQRILVGKTDGNGNRLGTVGMGGIIPKGTLS